MEYIKLPPQTIFQRHYLKKKQPVIITDATFQWQAMTKWTFEWFKQSYGDVIVPVIIGHANYSKKVRYQDMSLGDYIDSLFNDQQKEKGYMGQFPLQQKIPPLLEDFHFPEYYRKHFLSFLTRIRTAFWIGPAHRTTMLHCDYQHNLHAMIMGRKQIQLYAPNSLPHDIPRYDANRASFIQSEIERINFKTNELAPNIIVEPDYDFTLNSGEMLFIPYGWWHRVTSLEPSISINQWWMTPNMLLSRKVWQILKFLKLS